MSKILDKLKDTEIVTAKEDNLENLEIFTEPKETKPKLNLQKLLILCLVFVISLLLWMNLTKFYSSMNLISETETQGAPTVAVTVKKPEPLPVTKPVSKPEEPVLKQAKPQPDVPRRESYNLRLYRESKEYLPKLLADYKENPRNAATSNNIAAAYIEEGNFEDALRFAERALFSDPGNAFYWNNMGVILVNLNLYPDAEKCFNKAILISPDSGVFYYNLGNLFERLGNMISARENYLAYLIKSDKINPKNLQSVKEKLVKGIK
jgi:tetratricopeptide (TPR) repeat protein